MNLRGCLGRQQKFLAVLLGLFLALRFQKRSLYADGVGFQINRYEPTSAGEWSFGVEHPWYSKEPMFAFGLTLNYAHNPLSFGNLKTEDLYSQTNVAISHQWIAHIDIAGSVLNRILVSASLPVVLLERGNPIGGIMPLDSINAGDPRLGVSVRLFGEPMHSPFSISLGAFVWLPTHPSLPQEGESTVRLEPKVILGGLAHKIFWSFTAGVYYRPSSDIGSNPPHPRSTMGSQFTMGSSISYFDEKRNFSVGPELSFDSIVTEGHPFESVSSHLEILAGANYQPIQNLHLGLAAGIGILDAPGTPDFRALFRISYAVKQSTPKPLPPAPKPPVLTIPLCPLPSDQDHDGVPDPEDQCPTLARGDHPDPARPGCPDQDNDGDGVYDYYDQCPKEPQGVHPDLSPTHWGCPLPDRDHDGVYDIYDQCPEVPEGPYGDPKRPGCPLEKPPLCEAPMAKIVNDKIEIYERIYFATDKDRILSRSFPILQAVAEVLQARPDIKRLRIEGHTDDRSTRAHNMDLSKRRARSVMQWLITRGNIDPNRLEFEGYGPDRPVAPNTAEKGRAKNRRVEFKILDRGE